MPIICEKHGTVLAPFWSGQLNKLAPKLCALYKWEPRWVHEPCDKCAEEREREKQRKKLEEATREQVSPFGPKFRYATFINFDKDTQQKRAVMTRMRQWVDSAISGKDIGEKNILFLCGNTGTGKTHLMESAFKEMAHSHKRVLAFERNQIIWQMKNHLSIQSEEKLDHYVSRICNIPLLILDDFYPRAREDQSDSDAEMVFELFNGIYKNRTRTIITSNLNEDDFKTSIGKPSASRFAEMREKLTMPWGDKREQ